MAYSCFIIFATKTHQNVVFHVEEKFTILSLCNAKQEQWCRSAIVHLNLLLLYIQICYCCTFKSAAVVRSNLLQYIHCFCGTVMSNMRNVS